MQEMKDVEKNNPPMNSEAPVIIPLPGDWLDKTMRQINGDPVFVLTIQCKDCNRYIRHDRRCGYWNHGVSEDDFCSRAEERPE